jgi:CTP synthase
MQGAKKTIKIAVVGKYFGVGNFTLADSYISVIEAVKHAAWSQSAKPEMTWIDAEEFERGDRKVADLKNFDALVVPGGFGTRGIEGIIKAIQFARENNLPYLGLCYGMQLACIEFVRHVLGKENAHTVEVDADTPDPVVHINPFQKDNVRHKRYGGTMRLGAYDCILKKGSRAYKAHGESQYESAEQFGCVLRKGAHHGSMWGRV